MTVEFANSRNISQIFDNCLSYLQKNEPTCALYSNDGYKVVVHKVGELFVILNKYKDEKL